MRPTAKQLRMPLKQWLYEEAAREGVTPAAIFSRLRRPSSGARGTKRYSLTEQNAGRRIWILIRPGRPYFKTRSVKMKPRKLSGRQKLKLAMQRIMDSPGFKLHLIEQDFAARLRNDRG